METPLAGSAVADVLCAALTGIKVIVFPCHLVKNVCEVVAAIGVSVIIPGLKCVALKDK